MIQVHTLKGVHISGWAGIGSCTRPALQSCRSPPRSVVSARRGRADSAGDAAAVAVDDRALPPQRWQAQPRFSFNR
eukprot:8232740-Pyramimonas_sp.AAC.1